MNANLWSEAVFPLTPKSVSRRIIGIINKSCTIYMLEVQWHIKTMKKSRGEDDETREPPPVGLAESASSGQLSQLCLDFEPA